MAHPITSYCERHDLSLNKFAGRVGVYASTIYRLISHKRQPSAELMRRIRDASQGEITAEALITAHLEPREQTLCQAGTKRKGDCGDGVDCPAAAATASA